MGPTHLDDSPDTAEAASVEEFYRKRRLYQLSAAGEAAEQALAIFSEYLHRPGELQTTALHIDWRHPCLIYRSEMVIELFDCRFRERQRTLDALQGCGRFVRLFTTEGRVYSSYQRRVMGSGAPGASTFQARCSRQK
jgi:uncharacterized protein DUF2397